MVGEKRNGRIVTRRAELMFVAQQSHDAEGHSSDHQCTVPVGCVFDYVPATDDPSSQPSVGVHAVVKWKSDIQVGAICT